MKLRLTSLFAVAVLVLVGASTVSAQAPAGTTSHFAPYVDFGITGTGGGSIGLSNPNYRVGGGVESNTQRFLFDVNGQFDSANLAGLKGLANSKGGYTGTISGSAYLKVSKLLLGGGAFYSNQVVSGETVGGLFKSISANRNQIRPFVGGGLQFSRDRILVNYVLPGRDSIPQLGSPDLNDKTVQIRNEIFLGKSGLTGHLRLTQNLDISNNRLAGAGTAATNYTAGAGIKFVF